MDDLPDILLIGALIGAIVVLAIAVLFARRARAYLRRRAAIRLAAPAEIAGALAEVALPLAECETLLIQLGIKRERLNERRALPLVNMARVFDQSIYALSQKKDALAEELRLLTRENDAVRIHRRTQNLARLSAQSKDLLLRTLRLRSGMAELHSRLLAEINAAPLTVAAEARAINSEIDAATAGLIDTLRVKHGVQGRRLYRELYHISRAREIYATLPASIWSPTAALNPAELGAKDVDAADVVNRHYGGHVRAAIQRMTGWLASIQSISGVYNNAMAARRAATPDVTAALAAHPDQTIEADWLGQATALADIARQLAHVEIEALDALAGQARACEARIRAVHEQATTVTRAADDARRVNTAAMLRDEQWREAAQRTAGRLKAFEPGNFSPQIEPALLPAQIDALHADWRAIVNANAGAWDDWQRLAPTIRRFSDLNASLSTRLDMAAHELERAAARVRELHARLDVCVDGLQSPAAQPEDRRVFGGLRKQAGALGDRLRRIEQGHGLLNDAARRVADFEAGARAELLGIRERRFGECQTHAAALAEHTAALEKHAALNYDESLAKARTARAEFHAVALSKAEALPDLVGEAVSLSQTAGDLSGQARALGQWVQRVSETLAQIDRCAAETTALEERRARAAATLLSWIDYSGLDAILVDLRQRCAQAAKDRRDSSSLDLAESRLGRELAAHQEQLEETRDQVELFTRIQTLQREASARYASLSATLGGKSPELLWLYDHLNPGPFASMSATDAEIHFQEVIAEIDARLNQHLAKSAAGAAAPAADARLRQALEQLLWMCEGGISEGLPLRELHGETREAQHALARVGHISRNPALPHLRRVKTLWRETKQALATLPQQRPRAEYQRRLTEIKAQIDLALRLAGAEKSEYS